MPHTYLNKKNERLEVQDVRLLVKRQAMRHTRRMAANPLFDQQRPNEPEIIKKYRNGIKRMLSKDGYDRWCSKVGRIIEGAGLIIDRQTLNENTAEYLATEPLTYMWQYSGIQEYFLRQIIPYCIEDPNAMIVTFPYNPDFPEIPLSRPINEGGLPPNITPAIRLDVIPVEDIIYTDESEFLYYGFEVDIPWGDAGETKRERVQFQWTANEVFIWYPSYNSRYELTYTQELWYLHEFGFLPINFMPGRLSISEDGNYYNESYLHPYFEYADEFSAAYSDVQANRVSHLYPKVVMTEMPCPGKGCKGGKVKTINKLGEPDVKDCDTCSGTGIIKDGGPFSVIVQKASTGMDGEAKNANPYQYVTPPTEVFNIAWEKTFELLERGKRSVGLDLLLNMNESGVAMEHRLEDLEDLLKDFAGALIDTMEVCLECMDALLNVNPESRKAPKIIRPKKFDIKTALGHKMDYDNTLPFDRYNSALTLIQNKYRGDDVKSKVYKEAFKYAPELLLSEQEFSVRLASGIYQTINAIKRDYTVMLITEFAESLGEDVYLNTPYERTYEAIEQQIQQLAPAQDLPLFFNDNGEPE